MKNKKVAYLFLLFILTIKFNFYCQIPINSFNLNIEKSINFKLSKKASSIKIAIPSTLLEKFINQKEFKEYLKNTKSESIDIVPKLVEI
jgi:hypothetical protein